MYRLHSDSYTVCFPPLEPPLPAELRGTATRLKEKQGQIHPLITHHRNTEVTLQSLSATSRLTSLVDGTPASDPAVSTIVEHTVAGCQTHRSDVVCECDWRGQSEQSDVVVAGVAVIIWMQNDTGDTSGHFVWVCALQVVTAERNLPSRRTCAEEQMFGSMFPISEEHKKVCVVIYDSHPPGEAVSSRHHPLSVDEGTTTNMAAKSLQTNLPGPTSCWSVFTSNYPGVQRSDPTHCKKLRQLVFVQKHLVNHKDFASTLNSTK